MKRLSNTLQVNLVWMYGRSGVRHNEEVDTLAYRVTVMELVGPEHAVALPIQSLESKLNEEHHRLWCVEMCLGNHGHSSLDCSAEKE